MHPLTALFPAPSSDPQELAEETTACLQVFAGDRYLQHKLLALLPILTPPLRLPLIHFFAELSQIVRYPWIEEVFSQLELAPAHQKDALAQYLLFFHEEGIDIQHLRPYLACVREVSNQAEKQLISRHLKSIGELDRAHRPAEAIDDEECFTAAMLTKLPSEERSLFAQQAADLFTELNNRSYFRSYIRTLLLVPLAERADFIGYLKTLDTHLSQSWQGIRGDQRVDMMIKTLLKTPPCERRELLKQALQCTSLIEPAQAIDAGDAAQEVFLTLFAIKAAEWPPFCQQIQALVQRFDHPQKCLCFLSILSNVPYQERAELIQTTLALIDKHHPEDYAAILTIAADLPNEEWSALTEQTLSLSKQGPKIGLFQALRRCLPPEREEICHQTRTIANLYDLSNHARIVELIDALRLIPYEKRPLLIATAQQILQGQGDESAPEKKAALALAAAMLGCPIPHQIWPNLMLIAPTVRSAYFQHIARLANQNFFKMTTLSDDQQFRALLALAFSKNGSIKPESHTYLLDLLNEPSCSPDIKSNLCQTLLTYLDELQLHETHPLFIALNRHLSTENVAINRCPHRLYQQLQNQVVEEPENLMEGAVLSEVIDGRRARWARKKPDQPTLVTVSDLAAEIDYLTPNRLFKQLYDRLGLLPDGERHALLRQIRQSYLVDLATLRHRFLYSPFLIHLLKRPCHPHARLLRAQFHLFRSLQAVQDTFSTFTPTEKLSVGEKRLLQLAALAREERRTTRYQKLADYHRLLPIKYQLPLQGTAEQKGKWAVEVNVQRLLHAGLSNPVFLREVTGQTAVDHPQNAALYLAHRIGRQIGLAHSPLFDPQATLLAPALLTKTTSELLNCFFRHCTLRKAAQQLVADSADLMSAAYLPGILALLEKSAAGEPITPCFRLDAQQRPLALTLQGALHLLAATTHAHLAEDDASTFGVLR